MFLDIDFYPFGKKNFFYALYTFDFRLFSSNSQHLIFAKET